MIISMICTELRLMGVQGAARGLRALGPGVPMMTERVQFKATSAEKAKCLLDLEEGADESVASLMVNANLDHTTVGWQQPPVLRQLIFSCFELLYRKQGDADPIHEIEGGNGHTCMLCSNSQQGTALVLFRI